MGRTADVLYGSTSRERSSQSMGLVICVLFFALAAAPYPGLTPGDSGWGYDGDLWYMRAFAFVVGLTGVRGALSLGRSAPVQTLEISPDAIRWSDGQGTERTVARATVRRARCDSPWLEFEPAAGAVEELHVIVFDPVELGRALSHHGWLAPVDRRLDEHRARAYPTFSRRLGRRLGRLFGD